MRRVIFLIADGKQNPKIDAKTGERYDPVMASQIMYDDGVKIFAIGIGQGVDMSELERITRTPARVHSAQTVDELISDEFVKSVAKESCSGGILPTQGTLHFCFVPLSNDIRGWSFMIQQ